MDELRLILIGIGVALIAGIYLVGALGQRRRRRSRDGHGPSVPGDANDADDVDAEEFIERLRDRQAAINAEELTGEDGPALDRVRDPDLAEPAVARDEEALPEPVEAAPRAPPDPAPSPRRTAPAPPERKPVEQRELFDDLAGLSALSGVSEPEIGDLGALGTGRARSPEARPGPAASAARGSEDTDPPKDPLVLALTVMARAGESLAGERLRTVFDVEGLEYGPFGIYHRRGPGRPRNAPPEFSVANVVKPGTFDPESLDALVTPGLALFVQLPGPRDSGEAFEQMLVTARRIAERLDAVLCDETRSTLTGQSVNHLRERIAEHTRRNRLRK